MTAHVPALMRRRAFLKTLVAVGVAPVIAPEFVTQALAAPVAESVPTRPLSVLSYELWLGVHRGWNLVGTVSNADFRQDAIDTSVLGDVYRRSVPWGPPYGYLSIHTDMEGYGVLRDAFDGQSYVGLSLGVPGGAVYRRDALISEIGNIFLDVERPMMEAKMYFKDAVVA